MAIKTVDMGPIWEAYKAKPDPKLREELILHYLPLVKVVVRRLMTSLPRSILKEDLESYGTIGLLEALDRYDPGQGIQFETFAWPRIRGAILDHLRTLDPASRGERNLARRIQQEYERASAAHGRPATDEEVAAAMGIGVDALHEQMGKMRDLVVHSFEDLVRAANSDRGSLDFYGAGDPHELVERSELLDALRRGLGTMPDREKLVLGLYYYERLTLAEIASILNLTESRVCQIQSAALMRLRAFMTSQGFGEA